MQYYSAFNNKRNTCICKIMKHCCNFDDQGVTQNHQLYYQRTNMVHNCNCLKSNFQNNCKSCFEENVDQHH